MITIRPYTPTDKQAIHALFQLNTPKYFSPEEEKDLDFYLENEIEHYFVVELNQEIVGGGGINFKGSKTTAYLSWDFVNPKKQGEGIGTALVNHRVQLLLEMKNVSTIIVRTSQLVFPFYEKCGFDVIKKEVDYWAKGYDLYEMEYEKSL